MTLRLVERMTFDPCRCSVCGSGNIPNEVGDVGPFIDLGIEMGYMDHGYLCMDCGAGVGALAGMVTADEIKDARREVMRYRREIHDLKSQLSHKSAQLAETQRRLLGVEELPQPEKVA